MKKQKGEVTLVLVLCLLVVTLFPFYRDAESTKAAPIVEHSEVAK